MYHLGEDDLAQVMGIGQPGEVRQLPDGQLYGWVEAYDGLGNPIGFWKKLRNIARTGLRIASNFHPAARTAYNMAQGAGILGVADDQLTQVMGLGSPDEVRQMPDGQLYGWVEAYDGLGNPLGFWKKLRNVARTGLRIASNFHPAARTAYNMAQGAGLLGAEDQMAQVMGIGAPGEVREGPDGQLYGWVDGYDGLGNPIGFWKKLKKAWGTVRKVAKVVAPIASFIPGVGPVVAAAQAAGVLGPEESELIADPPYDIAAPSDEYPLVGAEIDPDQMAAIEGGDYLASEEGPVEGYMPDDGMQGYITDDGVQGYVREEPEGTRWFVRRAERPTMWQKPW